MADRLHQLMLDLHPNEASGLLTVADQGLLDAHGWQRGFWVVLDEGVVTETVAAIGHAGGSVTGGWEIVRLLARQVGKGKTEDCEAVTRVDGWVWIFGSQYGTKIGPLQRRRTFVARFREDEVRRVAGGDAVDMEVVRTDFLLHRLVNDAVRASGIPMLPITPALHEAFIDASIARLRSKARPYSDRVHPQDWPVNIEGATFRPGGNLLLGLRYPCAADGRPLLVELVGARRLFEGGEPEIAGVWAVAAIGRDGDVAGVRDLTHHGDELHLLTGNLDSVKESGSLLVDGYPAGRNTVNTHWKVVLPPEQHGGAVDAEMVREFPDHPRVEGIALDERGHAFYVVDEDEGVHVQYTEFMAGED